MSDALKERCNVRDYNDEIIDLGRAGRHEEILNVLGVMKRNKCWPTVLTYDLAVRACVEGQKIDPLALNVIRDMRSMGLRLEERTACCILNGSKNVLPSKFFEKSKVVSLLLEKFVKLTYMLCVILVN